MLLAPLKRGFFLVSADINISKCPKSDLRLILWWLVTNCRQICKIFFNKNRTFPISKDLQGHYGPSKPAHRCVRAYCDRREPEDVLLRRLVHLDVCY